MNFLKLYKSNKKAVQDYLISQWCQNADNNVQKKYSEKIKQLIENELFTSDNYIPMVQCMEGYPTINAEEYDRLADTIKNLWAKATDSKNIDTPDFYPYRHQFEAWNELNKENSMVVTTGTGSGKTECFMLPLIADLLNKHTTGVKAIFLYPLNALMEDQKARLQKLLAGTDLKFAVYNGNLPEKEDDNNPQEKKNIGDERLRYPNILATRQEMRSTPADIILTNPTMLEYMLLRDKDQGLFNDHALRWIVIDEAHTFSGAGAAEMAMLIRRVLYAFNRTAEDVRFAVSSATIGNDDNNQTATKRFITGLTGVAANRLSVISGNREFVASGNNEVDDYKKKLIQADFMSLNDLIKGEQFHSIEDKLEKLDELCESGLRAKVHFFYRIANTGIKVRLDQIDTENNLNTFKLYSTMKTKKTEEAAEIRYPYLDLMRCKKCGEYIAVGQVKDHDIYESLAYSTSDIFDENERTNKVIFGIRNGDFAKDLKRMDVVAEGNVYRQAQATEQSNIVTTTECKCPYCGEELNTKSDSNKELEKKVYQFKVYAREISRILAPSILMEQQPAEGEALPCNGRQYISFVDSRKSASASTLEQNLEQERLWIFRTIFKHLNSFSEEENKRISVYRRLIEDPEMLDDERNRYDTLLKGLENKRDGKLSWGRIYDILNNSPESDRFAEIFGKKDDDGTVNKEEKKKYILAAMVDVLERRQRLAEKDGETMGLFTTYYAKLDTVTELPQEVSVYFERVGKTGAEALTEWKNLLKIYLDTTVRSNQNTFFKDTEKFGNIDIMACQRFASKKPKRRSAKRLTCDNATNSNIVLLLAKGLAEEIDSLDNVVRNNREIISNVLTQIWDVLCGINLLRHGETYETIWTEDEYEDGTNWRLNFADLGFKRYENVYMVETGKGVYRPVETLFLGYSPYIIDRNNVLKPSNEQPENWGICNLMDGNIHTQESINEWVHNCRQCMCEKNVWGEHGVFSTQINFILSGFPIFYQAEHTAQVGKKIARDSQEKFKQHLINILACSTTMEMGVDLGSLETVLMASIPPHPQNYKQRAGRSGRRGNNRSVSITLCNSDSIGLRTLTNPMDTIIKKRMQVPTVDLDCPEIVQRHVNAFLLRESGQLSRDNNNLDMELIEFFTNYHFKEPDRGNSEWEVKRHINGTNNIVTVVPSDGLGDCGVRYTTYLDYLNPQIPTDLYNRVEWILRGTNYDAVRAVKKAKDSIEALFNRLSDYFGRISDAYNAAANNGEMDDGYVTTPPGPKLRLAFNAKLAENLITYFATNRYTPNANMPVDIIQFQRKVNNNNFSMKKPDNPSYPLRTALSQYSPGLSVIVNNKSYIVRGVRYTDIYNETQSFLTLYQVGDEVRLDHITEDERTNASKWKVSDRKELTLVQPTAFVTDQNESASRCVEQPYFPQCGAMLIGATDQESTNNDFISYRTSDSTNNSKVLYYNMGMGYGFCYCRTCGKAVPEVGPKQRAIPAEMQGHKRIDGGGDCGDTNPMRNVIFGNLIQTDYCEFSLLDINRNRITKRNENIPLLTTLGILFSRMFAEYINKDSNDIDFMILPNGRLCIFDVNPGGSGYSNRLPEYLDDVIDKIENVLNNAHSVDDILDKYSIRFINDVNLEVAKEWINAYRKGLNKLPEMVRNVHPGAIGSHRENLKHKIKTSDGEPILFVNNDYDKWDDMEMFDFRNAVFAFRKGENDHIPDSLSLPLTRISGKYRRVKTFDFSIGDGLYPLAIVDGFLYFTTERDHSNANSDWARGDIYKVEYDRETILQDYNVNTTFVIHLNERGKKISSNGLYDLVCQSDGAKYLFNAFYVHCQDNCTESVEVTYTDKYINTPLAVVTALQFIYAVIGKFENDYSLNINTRLSESNRNYPEAILNVFQDNDDLLNFFESMDDGLSECIFIQDAKKLPHYRELRLTCAGRTLVISPDGGFLNGWNLDKNRAEYEGIVYTVEDLTLDDNNIYLYQTSHDIKYTLELQDEN